MKGFGSDNHAGVHPDLLQSLIRCNLDHAPSYGTDEFSEEAIKAFRNKFNTDCEVFFVFNGTAANVLALRFLLQRHESIICTDISHLNKDECGAPEFFAGKLQLCPTINSNNLESNGKLTLSNIKDLLIRQGDQHYSQAKVISLTQPTELGTCYSLKEIKEIVDWAHSKKLFVHIDGARLSNALMHLNCTFAEMTTDLNVDIISFGGTKNGLMMGEAIIVLNPELAKKAKTDLKYIRKQCGQLPSKTRYIAAQFADYLKKDIYLKIAAHATSMADKLYQGLQKYPQIQITAARQSNSVFAIFPKSWIKKLRHDYFFYVWDELTFECRLMTSWDTTENEIDGFLNKVNELSKEL